MKGRIVRAVLGGLVVTGCVAVGAPVWAHHSSVAYEQPAQRTLEGVVTEVKWTNPHMFVYVDVKEPDGTVKKWSFEGGGVTAAINAGISPKLLKPGVRVKISGRRHLDRSKQMALLNTVEIDGKVYGRNSQINRPRVAAQ